MVAFAVAQRAREIGISSISVYRHDIDPLPLLAIVAITAMVEIAAAFVPARRATRMHPLTALRHD